MIDTQMKMMKKVAEMGNADDAWRYGYARLHGCYYLTTGEAVRCRRNRRVGIRWLEYSAEHGSVGAMLELDSYYAGLPKSEDTPTHLQRSLYWAKKAWRNGVRPAANNVAMTYSMLGRVKLCFLWLLRGYKECPWSVSLPLAMSYLCGYGVRQNVVKAIQLFNEVLLDSETAVRDRQIARRYCKMARAGNCPEAGSFFPRKI